MDYKPSTYRPTADHKPTTPIITYINLRINTKKKPIIMSYQDDRLNLKYNIAL